MNAAEDHGVSALSRAGQNTSLAMVETLIAAGADVNAAQVSGLVPSMTAARTGDTDVVRALLRTGGGRQRRHGRVLPEPIVAASPGAAGYRRDSGREPQPRDAGSRAARKA